jgi:hypothetical protein
MRARGGGGAARAAGDEEGETKRRDGWSTVACDRRCVSSVDEDEGGVANI